MNGRSAGRWLVAGCLAALLGATAIAARADDDVQISGELKRWHRVTLTFAGPQTDETATPNPFRDYRLVVFFRHGERTVAVPGYFAADGNAAETGAAGGNRWRVHFMPDAVGEWRYAVSFRQGKDLAVDFDLGKGQPLPPDGRRGAFTVGPTDKQWPDFRARGALRYVGEHYLRLAETGEWFLKGGADSPENFLAYADFDGTQSLRRGKPRPGEAASVGLHRYEPHLGDWRPGDPTWRDGKGKGIVGALNYLSGEGMNSVYFLTMNVEGDGYDVWPWTAPDVRDRYDVSKLDQWEIVFSHMTARGLMLHVITQETENDQLLDGGDLGLTRKLYYRELIARFAHHPALVWNLGEENTNTDAQRMDFCRFFRSLDPYDHPIVVHTYPGQYEKVYRPLLGFPQFEGPSLQTNDTYRQTLLWRTASAAAGRKWFVCLDEIGPADVGVKPDADDPDHDEVRYRHLWGNLMAGGAGCEWYFGYKYPHNDLNCEDWRSRENMWRQTRYALEFFQRHLPFWEMEPAAALLSRGDGYCFARPGHVYAAYLPRGTADVFLPEARYRLDWYNPRQGGALLPAAAAELAGPGWKPLGPPPADADKDWVALLRLVGDPPAKIDAPPAGGAPGEQAQAAALVVRSLSVIDAETGRPLPGLEALSDPAAVATVRLADAASRKLNVVAHVEGGRPGSVRFDLNDRRGYRMENEAPYALEGDTAGKFHAWSPAPGNYTITATPFTRGGGQGAAGRPLAVRLVVQ